MTPSLSFDGTNALASWNDRMTFKGLVASRLDATGNLLDPLRWTR